MLWERRGSTEIVSLERVVVRRTPLDVHMGFFHAYQRTENATVATSPHPVARGRVPGGCPGAGFTCCRRHVLPVILRGSAIRKPTARPILCYATSHTSTLFAGYETQISRLLRDLRYSGKK